MVLDGVIKEDKLTTNSRALADFYKGWDGYQVGLVHAVAPLSSAQLTWRAAPQLRSVGEIARHIIEGRITWFQRIPDVGREAFSGVAVIKPDGGAGENAAELVKGLETTWRVIESMLKKWNAD